MFIFCYKVAVGYSPTTITLQRKMNKLSRTKKSKHPKKLRMAKDDAHWSKKVKQREKKREQPSSTLNKMLKKFFCDSTWAGFQMTKFKVKDKQSERLAQANILPSI